MVTGERSRTDTRMRRQIMRMALVRNPASCETFTPETCAFGADPCRSRSGSCRCGAVRFSVASHTPYPYQLCYCSICRKTAGGGGFAINIMGDARTLAVDRAQAIAHLSRRDPRRRRPLRGQHRRAPFLQQMRERAVAVQSGMARARASLRLGNRHRPAGAAVTHSPDAQVQGELGRAGDRPA